MIFIQLCVRSLLTSVLQQAFIVSDSDSYSNLCEIMEIILMVGAAFMLEHWLNDVWFRHISFHHILKMD